jgi:hypothetical protein
MPAMLWLLVFVVPQSLMNEQIQALSAALVLVLGLVLGEAVLLQSYFFLNILQPVYTLSRLFSVYCILKEVDYNLLFGGGGFMRLSIIGNYCL